MSVIGSGIVQVSGGDVASFFYNTRKGLAKFAGVFYWFFRRKVTVSESGLLNHVWPMRDALFIRSFIRARKVKISNVSPGILLGKQQFLNSCAAQSLRQAAFELGVNTIPKGGGWNFNGQSIKDDSAETAIYGITGELLDPSGRLKVSPEHGPYSYPAGICRAARALGLDGGFYCTSDKIRDGMKRAGGVWDATKACAPIKRRSPPSLCNNERLIVHCQRGSEGHYIMKRPDGSCYDPKKGRNYRSLADYQLRTAMIPSGWSIMICHPERYQMLSSF